MSSSEFNVTPFSATDPVKAAITSVGGASAGGTASSNKPTITGTGEPGQVVNLYDGVRWLGSTTVASDGTWSITATTALKAGKHSFTAICVGADGVNGLSSEPLSVTVPADSSTIPPTPVIGAITDHFGPVQGNVAPGGSTDDPKPTISGSNAKPGDIIIIKDGNTPIGSAIVQPNGTWSVTPDAPLNNGSHNITATEKNPATGVSSPASTAYPITVDTTVPTAPAIGGVTDHVGPVTGNVASGGTTDDSTPTFTGTGKPGDIVIIKDGSTPIGSAVVDGNGNWSVTPASPLGNGSHNITATEKNPATGATGPASTAYPITVDTTVPTTPNLTQVDDHVGPVQGLGAVWPNHATDDPQAVFNGNNAGAGNIVKVYDNGNLIGSTTADSSGNWTFKPATAMTNGAHDMTFTATKPSTGAVSATSSAFPYVVDTTVPTAPAIGAITDNVGPVTGSVASGGTTDDTKPIISGSGAKPGDIVIIKDGTTPIGSAIVQPNGTWSVTPDASLSNGLHNITATEKNPATGATGPASTAYPITVDTTVPTAPAIGGVTDHVGPVTGNVASGGTTDDSTPTFTGTGKPGDIVIIKDGSTPIGSAVVDGSGNWSVTPANPLDNGSHNITATEKNPATGATGPASAVYPITVDTTVPTTPNLTQVDDHVGPVQGLGAVWPNHATDDPQAVFNGNNAGAGNIVKVYDNGNLIGSTTADSSGNWTFKPATAMTNGAHDMTFTATKPSTGAVSATSSAFHYTVDTTLPATPHLTQVDDHVGPNQGLGAIWPNTTTDDPQATFRGDSVSAGNIVKVYDNGNLIGSTTADSSGNWSFTPANPMANGAHDMTFTATKLSTGAVSATSGAFHYTIDTTLPTAQTPTITGLYDHVGAITGNIASGGQTDDTKPTLSGSGHAGDTIKVYDGSNLLGSATVGGDGKWSFTPSSPLPNGGHDITATASASGQSTSPASGHYTFTVDAAVPTTPNLTQVDDHVGPNQGLGAIWPNTTTDDPQATFRGDSVSAGNIVKVYDNGNLIGSTTADSSGNWTFKPATAMTNGAHDMTFTATKTSTGAVSATSGAFHYTVDTTLPATPHLTQVDDHVGPNQGLGAIWPNTTTDDPQATFRGDSVSAGNIVKVYDNGNLIGSTTADSSGNWSFTPANPMTNGAHDMTFTATKTSTGAVSATSGAFHYTIDTTVPAPQTPTITGLYDDVGPATGNVPSGGQTDDTRPALSGSGHAGDTIKVYDGGTLLGSVTVGGDGKWSFTPSSSLPNGGHDFTATASANGQSASASSNHYTVTVGADPDGPPVTFANVSINYSPIVPGIGWYVITPGSNTYGRLPYDGRLFYQAPGSSTLTLVGTSNDWANGHMEVDPRTYPSNGIFISKALINGHWSTFDVHTAGQLVPFAHLHTSPTGNGGVWPLMEYVEIDPTAAHNDAVTAAVVHDDSTTTTHHTVDANGAFTGTTANETVDLNVDPQAYFAKASAHIAGGGGIDTIALGGSHQILDLTSLTGKTATAKISGVEVFDLGGHQNTLKVSLLDVLNLGEKDLFVQDGKQQVVVKGAAGDAVDLSNTHVAGVADGQWEQHGTAQVGGVTYAVYEHSGAHVELLVQQGVATTVHQ